MNFRPHLLTWTTPNGPSTKDANGYTIPGTPGVVKQVPCHWLSGKSGSGVREFKNEDGSTSEQKGRIRIDVDSELPEVGQLVTVTGHFSGVARDIYKGQLSWRIDV